jgi:hypothetical protein
VPLDRGDKPAAPGLLASNRAPPPRPLNGDWSPASEEFNEPVGDCGGNAPRAGVLGCGCGPRPASEPDADQPATEAPGWRRCAIRPSSLRGKGAWDERSESGVPPWREDREAANRDKERRRIANRESL